MILGNKTDLRDGESSGLGRDFVSTKRGAALAEVEVTKTRGICFENSFFSIRNTVPRFRK